MFMHNELRADINVLAKAVVVPLRLLYLLFILLRITVTRKCYFVTTVIWVGKNSKPGDQTNVATDTEKTSSFLP